MFKIQQKNLHVKIMLTGFSFSILYWLLDTLRDAFLLGGKDFLKLLIPENLITIWIRLLGVFMIILLSGFISIIISKRVDKTELYLKEHENDQYIKTLKDTIPDILTQNVKTNMLSIRDSVDKFLVDAEKSLSPGNISKLLKIRESFEEIITPVERLADFSAIAAGFLGLKRIAFNVKQVISQAVAASGDLLKEKNITVDISFSDDDMLIYADFDKIKNVVINILGFCIDYSDNNNKLLINVIDTESDIVFTISGKCRDSSKGIFNRVFINGQAALGEISNDDVLSTVIARASVLSHKGRIWLSRNRNNNISVSFSIAKETIPTVMIIDDDLNTVLLIKEVLERDKYRVIGKTDGEDALRVLDDEEPDLIIVDLMMPGIDGYEFIEKIKTQFNDKNIPLIIISGFHLDRNILMEVTGGQTTMPYIKKPIDIHELRKSVQDALSKTEKLEWNQLFIN